MVAPPPYRHAVPPAVIFSPATPYRAVALFISKNADNEDKADDVCGSCYLVVGFRPVIPSRLRVAERTSVNRITGRPGLRYILDHLPRNGDVVEPPAAERTPHRNDLVARIGKDLAVVGTNLVAEGGWQRPVEQEGPFHLAQQLPCFDDGVEDGLAELGWQYPVLALDLHQAGDRL